MNRLLSPPRDFFLQQTRKTRLETHQLALAAGESVPCTLFKNKIVTDVAFAFRYLGVFLYSIFAVSVLTS